MSVARTALAAAALLVLPPVVLAQHGAPKPPGLAHYDVFADGAALHLLLGERTPGGMALKYRRSDDGGARWSAPAPVTGDGDSVFAPHPGETAQVAAHDGRLLAIWTEANGENGRGGTVASAVSDDDGRTWKRAATPANDGSKRYHALVELGAGSSGFHAVWLHGEGGDGVSSVNYAHSTDGTTWGEPKRIDDSTCHCCWNRIVETDDGVGVLYRDGAPRDMTYASLSAGKWATSPVGAFAWDFKGCPHVGGALAAKDDALHALVWTGVDAERSGLYHLASKDGKAWSEPARIAGGDAAMSDLAIGADGTLTALWARTVEGGSVIERATSKDGKSWADARPVSKATARATQPRVVASGDTVATFWVEREPDAPAALVVNGTRVAP